MNNNSYSSRLEDFFSGSFTGGRTVFPLSCLVVTRFIIAPLDVVKIRFLSSFIFNVDCRPSIFDMAGKSITVRLEPFLVLLVRKEWRNSGGWFVLCVFSISGNLTAEIYWFLYSGVQFSCYEFLQLHHSNLVSSSFSSGAISSAVTTLVTYPFDILRTRFVYQGKDMYYKHILTGFASIIRDEGVLGIYKGLLPCLASIMPYMGSCFYIVEFLRSQCYSFHCLLYSV